MRNNVQILLSSARGVFIPANFVESFDLEAWGVDNEAWAIETIKQGPDSEQYWDAWTTITDNARFLDDKGIEWVLYQDGDLFAVAWGNMTEEEKEDFCGF